MADGRALLCSVSFMLTDIYAECRGAYKISVSEAPFKVLHSKVVLTHKDSTLLVH